MAPKNSSLENNGREYLNWTRSMDDALIDAFMHEHNEGRRVNGTFTSTAYENICKVLSELFARKVDKEKVKNRWKTLKKSFSEVCDIFKSLSGFAWNSNTQLWDAEPEVWDALIKSKPKAAFWRTTPFPNYEKMMILYGNDRANGKEAETAAEWRKRRHSITDEEINETINDIDNLVSRNEATLENYDNFIELDGQDEQDNSHRVNSAGTKKKRKMDNEKINDIDKLPRVMEKEVAVLAAGNEALHQTNMILKETKLTVPQLSGEEIWSMLIECGCEVEKVPKIYCFLMGDVYKLRTVVQCPFATRKAVIMQLMCGSSKMVLDVFNDILLATMTIFL